MKINKHFIVCGFGSAGKVICLRLFEKGIPFSVIDNNELEIAQANLMKYNAIQGNATEDVTLSMAGIEIATGLIACLPLDSDNLFVSLAAKELNPNLYIIACGKDEAVEKRLMKSGAGKVFYPSKIGAEKIADLILGTNTSMRNEKNESSSPNVGGFFLKSQVCMKSMLVSEFLKVSDSCKKILRVESSGQIYESPQPEFCIEQGSTLLFLRKK